MKQIAIRRFNAQGSQTILYALAEAEQVAKKAWDRGCLIIDEDQGKMVTKLNPNIEHLLIIDPIIGG